LGGKALNELPHEGSLVKLWKYKKK